MGNRGANKVREKHYRYEPTPDVRPEWCPECGRNTEGIALGEGANVPWEAGFWYLCLGCQAGLQHWEPVEIERGGPSRPTKSVLQRWKTREARLEDSPMLTYMFRAYYMQGLSFQQVADGAGLDEDAAYTALVDIEVMMNRPQRAGRRMM